MLISIDKQSKDVAAEEFNKHLKTIGVSSFRIKAEDPNKPQDPYDFETTSRIDSLNSLQGLSCICILVTFH